MSEQFISEIRPEVEEFLATRRLSNAITLTQHTGQHFNHNQYPMYFTGDLEARMVLVHLNPKQTNTFTPTYEGVLWLPTFDAYIDYHRHFGRHNNENPAPTKPISQFDSKQIQFLRPFNVIDFAPEQTRTDRFHNLVKVIDEKLQLELIPYGSDTFSTQGFTPAILHPYIERLLRVITSHPRNFIIFCGRIFANVFDGNITNTYTTRLSKNDGTQTKNYVRFSTVQLQHNGQQVVAGVAHSFAQQGIPMAAYGRFCHEHYGK